SKRWTPYETRAGICRTASLLAPFDRAPPAQRGRGAPRVARGRHAPRVHRPAPVGLVAVGSPVFRVARRTARDGAGPLLGTARRLRQPPGSLGGARRLDRPA